MRLTPYLYKLWSQYLQGNYPHFDIPKMYKFTPIKMVEEWYNLSVYCVFNPI